MNKLLAILLSFALVFTNLVPSFAQNKGTASRGTKTLPAGRLEPQVQVAKQDNVYVENGLNKIEQRIKAKLTQESDQVLSDSREVSIALGLDPFYKALGVQAQKKGESSTKNSSSLTLEEAKTTLKNLSKRIYMAAQQEKSAYSQEALKAQAHVLFPVFESLGALDPTAKKWEAANLRTFIRANKKACTSDDANKCHAVLTAIRALPILDERTEQGEDAMLVDEFLEANYQSPHASSVLQTGAIALMALGRENMLVAFIQKAERQNVGFWDRLGNSMSFAYWSDKGEELAHGGDRWVARANQGSYYRLKNKGQEKLGNIYQDLGEWLATEKENGKYLYRNQIDLSGFLHAYENGVLQVNAPAFVTGALLGGMTLPSTANLKQIQSGHALNGQGRGQYTDTSAAWNAVQKRLDALHTNTTGLALQELYAHPKAEMSYAQRTMLNNRLVARYNQVTPQVNGKKYQPSWMKTKQVSGTEQFFDSYFASQKQAAQVADIGVAVIGIASGAASGFGIAKLTSFGIRTISKAR